ncbi:flagellar motor switch protein FliG [Mangrovimicrobium sediminis]|uniref:Flagellar motor switch protein FliG n=1 Tax=Mangrovimicrobium sediminis TaxID=2562682 RepID=A0A4Z0M0L9_9GAMM|nr:flagellar motor switch protein FliG [Haliea sp. SAOS-164]TGD73152.1 flagellar motor switch protein FliG [Haliea sp. SAOS-164]
MPKPSNNSSSGLPGLRKSAIVLLSLEEEATAEVLKHMSSREIQEVSQEMATVGQVSHADVTNVLEDFYVEAEEYSVLGVTSTDHIQNILVKVLGNDRALSLIEDITETKATHNGIDALNLIDPGTVAEMIRDEHPQIIATILVHLERGQAADILAAFEEKVRNDIMLRIATFSGVQPAALQTLTEVLTTMISGQNLKRSKMGGVKTAAEILNLMNSSTEEAIIENVRGYDEDLVQKIIDEMFLFENLENLDDASIKLVLKEIDTNTLTVALKGAPQSLVDKFLGNMSQRASQMLIEDMEARGPMRLSVVEEEQKTILQVVRRMADSGEIILSSADESYV